VEPAERLDRGIESLKRGLGGIKAMTAVSIKELASTMIISVGTSATVHNVNQNAAHTYAKPSSSCIFVVLTKWLLFWKTYTHTYIL